MGDEEGSHKLGIYDYRAYDPELKALKLRMWMKDDMTQLQELRSSPVSPQNFPPPRDL
jgi:hypothetical protein